MSQNNAHPAFIQMSMPISRRQVLKYATFTLASVCANTPNPAFALKPGKPSKEKLLRGLQEDKSPEEIEAEKERVQEERRKRLEKQKELQAEAERRKAGEEDNKMEDIESNLRGQYYFPTARKRYLPRVKLAWETIPLAEKAVAEANWTLLSDITNSELSDAVLPMKLYISALTGGGLNINAKFMDGMSSQAQLYETATSKLVKAVKKKKSGDVVQHLADMKGAIAQFRQYGRLQADDFGIGEIPKDTRVGSGFGNNNSALYRRNRSVQEVTIQD